MTWRDALAVLVLIVGAGLFGIGYQIGKDDPDDWWGLVFCLAAAGVFAINLAVL